MEPTGIRPLYELWIDLGRRGSAAPSFRTKYLSASYVGVKWHLGRSAKLHKRTWFFFNYKDEDSAQLPGLAWALSYRAAKVPPLYQRCPQRAYALRGEPANVYPRRLMKGLTYPDS
jgi:hypothetical protein